jgi:RNA polymerase sigma factor (TIGR02999 family)
MSIEPDPPRDADALVALLYDDLRRLARRSRWQVSAGGTVQTTALVHEAYLKLRNAPGFADRQHFLRSAAVAMRHILINIARAAVADKRGAGAARIPLDDAPEIAAEDASALLELDQVLDRLRAVSERLAQVVECRFFAGYSDEETAEALALSDRTVRRDWLKARAWLRRELGDTAWAAGADERS